jgi:hypothetical protein
MIVRSIHLSIYCGFQGNPNDLQSMAKFSCLAWSFEGIVELLAIDSKFDQGDTIDARDEIIRQLKISSFSQSAKQRIERALQNVGSPSVKDGLYDLVSKGQILEDDVAAWNSLRNKYAHLRKKAFATHDTIIDVYQKYLRTARLTRHLCFSYIGYHGKYTDYTLPGFPAAEYPPSPAKL